MKTDHLDIEEKNNLYEKLLTYSKSDYYPFHMPGHKRNAQYALTDPVSIDITEITDFDNLHHSEGILLREQQFAAKLYGAGESFFLVNGSTCGVLSAISACVKKGGKLLICRNAHKSVYHAAYLRELRLFYLMPEESDIGCPYPVTEGAVERALRESGDIEAVLITSPTYEGFVADIKAIARVVHAKNIPLIVDEAHGAHLGFHDFFPQNALAQGADIVIQSMHKTLPSLTQTALLHVGKEAGKYVDVSKIKRFLGIYQTSSPSYVFMGAMAKCLRNISKEQFEQYAARLTDFYKRCSTFKYIHVYETKEEAFVKDPSKLILYVDDDRMKGQELFDCLRDRYHLECEMASLKYVLAMTSVCDTDAGFDRLFAALQDMDSLLAKGEKEETGKVICGKNKRKQNLPEISQTITEALDEAETKTVELEESAGCVSGEYIYCYPPGTPIIVPGERIRTEELMYIKQCREEGLCVQGTEDYSLEQIKVIKENFVEKE